MTAVTGGSANSTAPQTRDSGGSAATAELQVPTMTTDPAVASARGLHGRSDLDRHADALATLAGFVRRAFIGRAR